MFWPSDKKKKKQIQKETEDTKVAIEISKRAVEVERRLLKEALDDALDAMLERKREGHGQ